MFEAYCAVGTENRPKPPVKWAGGKGQLIPQLEPLLPKNDCRLYLEPFLGGGALFFHLLPSKAVLIDNNEELMNFYLVVRDNLEQLLDDLRKHENTAEYYYKIRALDAEKLSPVERASRFLYLNKTAYNGLWRVNSSGKHNVPFGRYKNPRIADEHNLRLVSEVLKQAELIHGDFSRVLDCAGPGSFVYFDPPYRPLNITSNFTSYSKFDFSDEDQIQLAHFYEEMSNAGALVMLSNSDPKNENPDDNFFDELYCKFYIHRIKARRAINSNGERRGLISEILVTNYKVK